MNKKDWLPADIIAALKKGHKLVSIIARIGFGFVNTSQCMAASLAKRRTAYR